jgi:hypothetical protein
VRRISSLLCRRVIWRSLPGRRHGLVARHWKKGSRYELSPDYSSRAAECLTAEEARDAATAVLGKQV